MLEKCENCKFYADIREREPVNETGVCRRYPPVVENNIIYPSTFLFPDVLKTSWCGEYKVRE